MGFRQLHLFNLAMLAKQLWRIWCYSEKLLRRVLRARYFPNGDVLSASLGTHPSFVWRSIMVAQSLFRVGYRWRVSSGSSISVWRDPWIPRSRSFKPITPVSPTLANLGVSDLIDPSCGDWKVELVQGVFWLLDRDCILGISLSRAGNGDQLIWHYSINGKFSVRNAYHLTCTLEDKPSSSSREEEAPWWCKVWQAKLPHKATVSAPRSVGWTPSSWQAPSVGYVKVNFDGATFALDGAMGVGVVARDATGLGLAWLSLRVPRAGDGEMAEAWAAPEALQLALRRGWSSVVLEGDNTNLMRKLEARERDFSPIGPIVFDINYLADKFLVVHFSLIRRIGNAITHFFARSAFISIEGGSVVPPAALRLLTLDSHE
ncbi:UNVERIFIED_CONTAM: putative mitochondrial protein [Sesamum radiatum]|uniref:Mitochondrial protein n=1 Tax=Sesamum radiatum TaxID=300843 RepID=A0AAW2V4M2_SESRA